MKNVKHMTTAESNQPSFVASDGKALTCSAKRGRGRPSIHHPNERVQAFVACFASPSELKEAYPLIDDCLVGITHLQTEGQASTRPLSKRRLFDALQQCENIDTASVARALGNGYSPAAVKRYAIAARVASKAIASQLDQHPMWEVEAAALREGMESLDRPYFAAMQVLGLM